jgi:hypothetical protein
LRRLLAFLGRATEFRADRFPTRFPRGCQARRLAASREPGTSAERGPTRPDTRCEMRDTRFASSDAVPTSRWHVLHRASREDARHADSRRVGMPGTSAERGPPGLYIRTYIYGGGWAGIQNSDFRIPLSSSNFEPLEPDRMVFLVPHEDLIDELLLVMRQD